MTPVEEVTHAQPPPTGLEAACDVLVWRVLERAGNRLKGRSELPPGVASHEVHTHRPPTLEKAVRITADSWDYLPAILAEYGPHGVTVGTVKMVLLEYVIDLLVQGQPHSTAAMRLHLSHRLGLPHA